VAALTALNAALPRVYRALAASPSADAHCDFSEAQLFSEGIALAVRPPGQRWRPFGVLSGGQQALAALALSFALQVGGRVRGVDIGVWTPGRSAGAWKKGHCGQHADSAQKLGSCHPHARPQELLPSPFYFLDEIDACEGGPGGAARRFQGLKVGLIQPRCR
jgi:hypothetical protein